MRPDPSFDRSLRQGLAARQLPVGRRMGARQYCFTATNFDATRCVLAMRAQCAAEPHGGLAGKAAIRPLDLSRLALGAYAVALVCIGDR